jgi:hypothetical protein
VFKKVAREVGWPVRGLSTLIVVNLHNNIHILQSSNDGVLIVQVTGNLGDRVGKRGDIGPGPV